MHCLNQMNEWMFERQYVFNTRVTIKILKAKNIDMSIMSCEIRYSRENRWVVEESVENDLVCRVRLDG